MVAISPDSDVAAPSSPRRPPDLLVLPGLSAGVFAAAKLCLMLPRGPENIAPIWLPNAIALALLLSHRRTRWPALITACCVGHAAAILSAGYTASQVALFLACSIAEYLSAALLIQGLVGREIDVQRARHLFVLCAACTGCALLAGLLEGLGMWELRRQDFWSSLHAWALSHPLSLVLATPCLLVLSRPSRHLQGGKIGLRTGVALIALVAVAAVVFLQARFPILFLMPPALLAVSFEAGVFGAAIAVLITAAVALPATMLGFGPVALSQGDVLEKSAVLQLFLVVSLWSSIPVAGLQMRQRQARAQAHEEARRARRAEAVAAQSEARYRSLTDEASDAISAMDMAGLVTFISPAAETITGYRPDELVGTSVMRFVAREDRPAVVDNFNALVDGRKQPGSPIEYRFRHRDGRWIWLQANPRILRDPDGALLGTVDVIRDVTVRKTMEQELEAARRATEAASQAKTDFLANMSHELRTPLTGILGYAEVLEGDPALPAASRSHAQRIRTAGSSLLALVNDVLDLSRMEAGRPELKPAPIDLAVLLQTAVDMVRPLAQQKSLALSVEHAGACPRVMADPDRLQQILINLLGNAVKFTPRGVVTASLRCDARGPDVAVRLSVSDTGVGIPTHRLQHVFDRFEQADASVSRRFGGTGLGLAISRALAQAMGGELTVESTEGAGSVFTLRLVLPRVAVAGPLASSTPAPAPRTDLKGLRVLLAEDVAVNRDLIALMMKPFGVELHVACDGAAAVEAASTCAFDLILMDMQMPVMDGLEATRRIRAGGGPSASARITALTANVLPPEVERCRAAGMDDHLGKPLSAAALGAKLAQARAAPAPDADASPVTLQA